MTRVLAAIDDGAEDDPVLSTAESIAGLLGALVEAVRKPTVRDILEMAEENDVVQVVASATAASLKAARALRTPIVVVPPATRPPAAISRILVPIDGTRETAEALAPTFELAYHTELTVIALHVLEYADLPMFSDQPHYEAEAWAREFLRRHFPHPELVRLEVRVGAPGEHVLALADAARVDLVALGWAQRVDEGRAAVVLDVLAGSRVPVLLVPVHAPVAQPAHSSAAAAPVRP